jgi:RHS repeat-associated protein
MNEYAQIGAAQQSHDPNGNLTSDGERHYHFDAKNRLVRVSTLGGNTIATYKYDAFGRRIEKRAGSETVRYVHFGKQVLEERDIFSQLQRQYVYGRGVDEVLQLRNAANEDFYYHDNSIGSIAAISDTTGSIVERYRYNAYGETTVLSGDGLIELTSSSIGNAYGFTGRRLDTETGFYYYRARFYSPERGRFVQRDPLGYADGMGVYAYVGNNPVNFIDPSGTEKKCESVRCNSDKYGRMDEDLNSGSDGVTPSDWFEAAELVTEWNGVGATDWPYSMGMDDDVESYLEDVHHKLAEENKKTYESLRNGETYGKEPGAELDKYLVAKEQKLVTQYTDEYFNDPKNKSKKDEIMKELNDVMDTDSFLYNRVRDGYVTDVLNNEFKDEKYDQNNEKHRIRLGEGLIDSIRKERGR